MAPFVSQAAGNAKMTEQTVSAEMIAFQNVSSALGLTPKQVRALAPYI
jgi:hypothetical protein